MLTLLTKIYKGVNYLGNVNDVPTLGYPFMDDRVCNKNCGGWAEAAAVV